MFGNILAIGDIHGDSGRLRQLMEKEGLIKIKPMSVEADWIAEDTLFVFTGDYVDRGPNGIEVIQDIISWKEQAPNLGSKIVTLCGNHDAAFLSVVLDTLTPDRILSYNEMQVFGYNGGNLTEALQASKMPEIIDFLQSLNIIHVEEQILFQHADGFDFYLDLLDEGDWPIGEINRNGKNKLQFCRGAWDIFYEMTDSRYFVGRITLKDYLDLFGCRAIVHGHTRHTENKPKIENNGVTINIDGSLSRAYQKNNKDRGFIYRIK